KHYDQVNLMILAPKSYYSDYGLIDRSKDKIKFFKKALNDFSYEFHTNITLMALTIEKEDFFDKCRRIGEAQNIDKQQRIAISQSDAIPELARDKWQLLVSSDLESHI